MKISRKCTLLLVLTLAVASCRVKPESSVAGISHEELLTCSVVMEGSGLSHPETQVISLSKALTYGATPARLNHSAAGLEFEMEFYDFGVMDTESGRKSEFGPYPFLAEEGVSRIEVHQAGKGVLFQSSSSFPSAYKKKINQETLELEEDKVRARHFVGFVAPSGTVWKDKPVEKVTVSCAVSKIK